MTKKTAKKTVKKPAKKKLFLYHKDGKSSTESMNASSMKEVISFLNERKDGCLYYVFSNANDITRVFVKSDNLNKMISKLNPNVKSLIEKIFNEEFMVEEKVGIYSNKKICEILDLKSKVKDFYYFNHCFNTGGYIGKFFDKSDLINVTNSLLNRNSEYFGGKIYDVNKCDQVEIVVSDIDLVSLGHLSK